jgi:hypothetical protein
VAGLQGQGRTYRNCKQTNSCDRSHFTSGGAEKQSQILECKRSANKLKGLFIGAAMAEWQCFVPELNPSLDFQPQPAASLSDTHTPGPHALELLWNDELSLTPQYDMCCALLKSL